MAVHRRLKSSRAEPEAGQRLHHVDASKPGIRRLRRGRGFAYLDPDGQPLRDRTELARIAALAIPPAYTDVWICPAANGHLQATGRDSRGRKQYRYHAAWQQARGRDKFEHLVAFGESLPTLRRRVRSDLLVSAARGAPGRETVLAAVVRLLDTTLARIGNEAYARDNGSYGLTTLRRRHARIDGKQLRLRFPGKSGVLHDVALEDPALARVVRRCQALDGQSLFHYEDEHGELRAIGSADVNAYLRELSGTEITAKDFRTWHASALALALLQRAPERSVPDVVREVAQTLRNTAAVCRKSYVHPRVFEACGSAERLAALRVKPRRGLTSDERTLLAWLAS